MSVGARRGAGPGHHCVTKNNKMAVAAPAPFSLGVGMAAAHATAHASTQCKATKTLWQQSTRRETESAREASSSSPSCAWTVGPCVRARRDPSSLSHHCNPQRLTDTCPPPRFGLRLPPEKEKQKAQSFRAIAARSARKPFSSSRRPPARARPRPRPRSGKKKGEKARRGPRVRTYVRSRPDTWGSAGLATSRQRQRQRRLRPIRR